MNRAHSLGFGSVLSYAAHQTRRSNFRASRCCRHLARLIRGPRPIVGRRYGTSKELITGKLKVVLKGKYFTKELAFPPPGMLFAGNF